MAVLAIDLEGGDYGPSHLLPATLRFFQQHPQHSGLLFGTSSLQSTLPRLPANLQFKPCTGALPPVLNPGRLLRNEYGSSIEMAVSELKQCRVDAVVSSEHTGILMALLHRHGNVHSVVDRPVLVSWVPTSKEPMLMLDLGASFSASDKQLLGFAAVGVAIAAGQLNRKPRLALLNLGVEANKGPHSIRLASEQLAQWPGIDYRGFVEAGEVFHGNLDLVITDGFTGNAVIKAAEGTLDLALAAIRHELSRDFLGRMLGLLLRRRLQPTLQQLDPRLSNGALLAGARLTVVKSHGDATGFAFEAALSRAVEATEGQWCRLILEQLDTLKDNPAPGR
jgi:glycerol-3-phosphate acyltransferase PlsX